MTYFAIDVHKHTSTVVWYDPAEAEFGERRLPTNREQLTKLFTAQPGPWIVALEATRQAPAVCDWLRALDSEIHLVDPVQLSLIAQLRNAKTDLDDARLMLKALMHDYLPEAYLAPPAVADRRDLYYAHQNLRQTATKYRNLLRTELNKSDLDLPARDLMGVRARPQVEARLAQMPPERQVAARAYWQLLWATEAELAEVDRQIAARVKADPIGQQLLQVPGLGPILAWGCLALLGEIERFANYHKLWSYAGLAPRSFRSDKWACAGRLPQRCNKHLRQVAMQAVQGALRCRSRNRARDTYHRLIEQGHKKPPVAKVAAGREILRDVFFIWQRAAATLPAETAG